MFLVKISAIDFLFLIVHGLAASNTCTPKKKKKKPNGSRTLWDLNFQNLICAFLLTGTVKFQQTKTAGLF